MSFGAISARAKIGFVAESLHVPGKTLASAHDGDGFAARDVDVARIGLQFDAALGGAVVGRGAIVGGRARGAGCNGAAGKDGAQDGQGAAVGVQHNFSKNKPGAGNKRAVLW